MVRTRRSAVSRGAPPPAPRTQTPQQCTGHLVLPRKRIKNRLGEKIGLEELITGNTLDTSGDNICAYIDNAPTMTPKTPPRHPLGPLRCPEQRFEALGHPLGGGEVTHKTAWVGVPGRRHNGIFCGSSTQVVYLSAPKAWAAWRCTPWDHHHSTPRHC